MFQVTKVTVKSCLLCGVWCHYYSVNPCLVLRQGALPMPLPKTLGGGDDLHVDYCNSIGKQNAKFLKPLSQHSSFYLLNVPVWPFWSWGKAAHRGDVMKPCCRLLQCTLPSCCSNATFHVSGQLISWINWFRFRLYTRSIQESCWLSLVLFVYHICLICICVYCASERGQILN